MLDVAETTKRIFVDMDGTLAVFTPVDTLETLYQYGYFANLAPIDNVVAAVKDILQNQPNIEVHILSAYLTDSPHALIEKNQWLDEHLPEIDQGHRIFMPCGADKKDYIPGGIRGTDHLLDDYTHNLTLWEPPAKGIKLLNGINDTHGSWQGHRIDFKQSPEELAQNIVGTMYGQMPQQSEASIEDSKMEARLAKSNEYNRMLVEDLNYEEEEPEEDVTVDQTQAAIQQNYIKSPSSYRDRGGNGKICEAIKEHFDLLEYAQARGLSFKEKHGEYQCIEHDSMWIDPVKNIFVRNSRHVGGSVIDFVMHFDELPKADAISKLRQEMSDMGASYSPVKYAVFKEKQMHKEFILPPKVDGKYSRVFSYLIKTRHIDSKIVADLVKNHLIYEEAKYHNCVFVGMGYDGEAKSATLRSTGEKRFMGEVEGSQKNGWMVNPDKKALFICEAPIDAMSVMTMMKLGGKDYQQYSYYAEGGNPQHGMLVHHMANNPNVETVYLCHDNDEAGYRQAERAVSELQEAGFTGAVIRKLPKAKDFNADLAEQMKITEGAVQNMMQPHEIAEVEICTTP